jgi:hypothetical protein
MSTIQQIPLPTDNPSFSQRVSLSGTDYVLRFDYNGRENRWYLDVFDTADSPIVRGVKLIPEWPLLRRVADSRKPPGHLVCTNYSGNKSGLTPPGFSDLGRSFGLVYVIP